MNAIEYQYELKDLADYLILSTFVVPGYGGHYDYLVDLLATYPDDIETALSEYNRQVVSFWDEAMKQWVKNDYHDFDYYLENLEIKSEGDGKVPDSVFFTNESIQSLP